MEEKMTRVLVVLATVTSLVAGGCSGTSLPYKPEVQPSGVKVSAAYSIIGDRVRIEVDTGRRHLEEVGIIMPDGSTVRADAIELGPPTYTAGSPISIGVGGGAYGGSGGSVGGGGVGIGFPIGGGGSTLTEGNMYAFFSATQVGPPPWRVNIKLSGADPVVIVVGTAPSAPK
jgi:hypothetical protein